MKGRIIVSTLLALLLLVSMPVSALAATWDIGKGDITVNAESGGQTVRQGGGAAVPDSAPVITGTSKENTLTINAESGQTASVTLSGVNIDVRDKGKAAVSTTGEGNVSIELNGESTLRSGYEHAGLEKNNGGSLTIADEDKNGKLTAWGEQQGAGIGGGSGKDGSNIFITGGGVNAIGGLAAAGIGGGLGGNGSNITISGGKVGATNGLNGAGIGGGQHGSGSNITISGGEVNAIGGKSGAGIGGGHTGDGSDITISGGEVSASGGESGAGIGGGVYGKGEGITVSGNAQLKVRGGSVQGDHGTGAGIGGGGGSYGTNGAEVEPDICALNPGGKIEYYAPRKPMSGTPNKTVTNPTGDFVWDSGRVTTPATCTGKGVRTYTCTSSSHTRTEDIPALNHSFAGQAYVSDNNATCEQDGTKTVKCVRYGTGGCTATDTVTDTDSKLGHFFEDYVSDNNATCEQDGTKTAKCVRYGEGGCTATDTVTDTDSKLGHLFEDYISNNDATYARDGTKTAKCVRYDQCGETHTIPDEGSRLKLPLYRVTDRDGRDIAYTAEQTGGVLTVTVDEDFAILTGKLSGLRTLKSQGVEKIVFVTKGAASAFLLSDLLSKGESGEAYRLTHDTKAVTFTLGEKMTDMSAILTKP